MSHTNELEQNVVGPVRLWSIIRVKSHQKMQSGKALHGIWIFGIAKRKSPAVPLDLHQAVKEALEQKDTDMQDEWTALHILHKRRFLHDKSEQLQKEESHP